MAQRLENARQAAASYAPAPVASALMYGVIGAALFGVSTWGAVTFYDLPLLSHLGLLASGAVVAFCLGVWLRKKRERRYIAAYQAELVRLEGRSTS